MEMVYPRLGESGTPKGQWTPWVGGHPARGNRAPHKEFPGPSSSHLDPPLEEVLAEGMDWFTNSYVKLKADGAQWAAVAIYHMDGYLLKETGRRHSAQ